MDIRPPKPPTQPRSTAVTPIKPAVTQPSTPVQPPVPLRLTPKKRRTWLYWLCGVIAGIIIILAAIGGWYAYNLSPLDSHAARTTVSLPTGTNASSIAEILKTNNIIRSTSAFRVYLELTRTKNQLKAGNYRLSASQSVGQIVDDLVKGRTDAFNVTITPGLTLTDIKKVLQKSGFGSTEIDQALIKQYNHPLLATKPVGVNLEGYIYPETYQVDSETTVESLLIRTFDQFEKVLNQNNLLPQLQARGFTLHQGITLASVVQKEASNPVDQTKVAQVFEKRLAGGGNLGSDVTYIYGAKLLGVEPSVSLDSPYNTRIHPGLP
ncbi:MAG TPA: endolytic transglycosylase MltG, partial [Candidatus Saccharimonadales bacterium]|nr:endolytic transglycosylase MltG [Candidatus Saccharimonadales bacterium]